MAAEFQVAGANAKALFTLKVHRGDGMALLAMDWRHETPPDDFVGFAIEYREPNGDRFYPLKNRLAFPTAGGALNPNQLSTLQSPIQKFRWVHFPRNADLLGDFTYRVTPVFMGADDGLSYGETQTVAIELRRETYPGLLNVAFTRGFVASQAFVDLYESAGPSRRFCRRTPTRGWTSCRPIPRRRRHLPGWASRRGRRSSTSSTRRLPTTRQRSA